MLFLSDNDMLKKFVINILNITKNIILIWLQFLIDKLNYLKIIL